MGGLAAAPGVGLNPRAAATTSLAIRTAGVGETSRVSLGRVYDERGAVPFFLALMPGQAVLRWSEGGGGGKVKV